MDIINITEIGVGFIVGFLLVILIVYLFLPINTKLNNQTYSFGMNLNPSQSFMS